MLIRLNKEIGKIRDQNMCLQKPIQILIQLSISNTRWTQFRIY